MLFTCPSGVCDIFTWFLSEGADISHILSFQINNRYIFPSIFHCFNLWTVYPFTVNFQYYPQLLMSGAESFAVQISRLNLHEKTPQGHQCLHLLQWGSTPINLG